MLDPLFVDQPLALGPIEVWPIAGRLGHLRFQVPEATGVVDFDELEAPEVSRIMIRNRGLLPLVMPSGWLVEGLRQSRMVVNDVLIPAGGAVAVEVACVEAGRWGDPQRSEACGRAPIRVMVAARTRPRANETGPGTDDDRQVRVWTAVRAYEARTGRRPTGSLTQILGEDIRRSRSMAELASLIDSLDLPHGANGYVVAIGSHPALFELWSRPEPAADMLRLLLRGLLFDLPEFELGPPPRRGVVEACIDQVRAATTSELPSAGTGCQFTLDHQRLLGMGLKTEAGEFLHLTAMSREVYDLAA